MPEWLKFLMWTAGVYWMGVRMGKGLYERGWLTLNQPAGGEARAQRR